MFGAENKAETLLCYTLFMGGLMSADSAWDKEDKD